MFPRLTLDALEAKLNTLPEAIAFPAMIVGALGLVAVTYGLQLALGLKPAPSPAAGKKKN